MTWHDRLRDALRPVRMERIAIAAPEGDLREVLALVADAGCVELDGGGDLEGYAAGAVVRDGVAALAGWIPSPGCRKTVFRPGSR